MTSVLITGTGSGFGRLTAETVARQGHRVYAGMRALESRNATAAAELTALAEKHSLDLRVVPLDASDAASVDQAVATVVADAGRLDVLVNNVGIGSWGWPRATTSTRSSRSSSRTS